MSQKLLDDAKRTINECFYLNIASITKNNLPWNTPVYYTFDKDYNFYWGSPVDSVHSENIPNNPKIFITIYPYDENGIGVYIEGSAVELLDKAEILKALNILDRKGGSEVRNVGDYLNESPLRIYKAVPERVSVSTPETAEKYRGLWVDKRVMVQLL